MRTASPPLRFLLVVLGGWTAARAFFLAPDWMAEPLAAAEPPALARTEAKRPVPPTLQLRSSQAKSRGADTAHPPVRESLLLASARAERLARPLEVRPSTSLGTNGAVVMAPMRPLPAKLPAPVAAPVRRATDRWSVSTWAFVRRGEAAALAPGGTLGAGQVGARIAYRLNGDKARPLALTVRLYAPLRRAAGAEAALGLDWRPLRRLPLHVLAERRQALGREGRSAFAVTAYGGASEALGPFRIDAYGQTGLVGARSRDAFADGSLRLGLPRGRFSVGAGAWAAAQPGVSRADVGPYVSIRLPLAGKDVMLQLDWRFRAAGKAKPGSGPALTLASDF